MKCGHCGIVCYAIIAKQVWGTDKDGGWEVNSYKCSACNKFTFSLLNGPVISEQATFNNPTHDKTHGIKVEKTIMVYPRTCSRPSCPTQVPKDIAEDYNEACLVLSDSPKASAALSRRCLQNILRDPNAANAQQRDLAEQIDCILASKSLPSYIAESLDAVRNIGNFAAHPMKSKATDQILPVEAGEAEWNLDVIESLFDFYYVQPAIVQKKKIALNAKLQAAGKPPLKV